MFRLSDDQFGTIADPIYISYRRLESRCEDDVLVVVMGH